MARDYKDRGDYARKRNNDGNNPKIGRWLLIALLVISFAGFLMYLRSTKPVADIPLDAPVSTEQTKAQVKSQKKPPVVEKVEPSGPKFDFYTILPQAEVIVPEHEIKTRIREELIGKTRSTQYILQAGSFRDFKDADRLKAKLALMGIASNIEKAKVGDVIWHRIKLGPYAQLASIETIKTRLKKSGIDVMITEVPTEKKNKP